MRDLVIVAGVRTPIGNFGGALKDIPAQQLGELVSPLVIAQDEGSNVALTEPQLALYPPLFKEGGTVTAGNSCPLNNGAAEAIEEASHTSFRTLSL